jgi:hypothetical protein
MQISEGFFVKNQLYIGCLDWPYSCCSYRRSPYLLRVLKEESIIIEKYDEKNKYDIIIVNENCALDFWVNFRDLKTKIIFDFANSFQVLKPVFRGISRIWPREDFISKSLYENFKLMLIKSDFIVCNTPEQATAAKNYNLNVENILDFNAGRAELIKSSYKLEQKDEIRIVWEGGGWNALSFKRIMPVLRSIHREIPFKINLLTDLSCSSRWNGNYKWSVKKELESIFKDVPFEIYEWSQKLLSRIATSSDMAVLPINEDSKVAWARPENRLMILWHMGIPTVASANPAFSRAMLSAGLPEYACSTLLQWEEKLRLLIKSEEERRRIGTIGYSFAANNASDEALVCKWIDVFHKVMRV